MKRLFADFAQTNFWAWNLILFDWQFFPLTTEVQELQNVVEDRMQGELRLRPTAAHV
ncbi:MAG: hypothetical protein AAF921_19105 [Cyanobacteria bacterium P01_D01_bin.44]